MPGRGDAASERQRVNHHNGDNTLATTDCEKHCCQQKRKLMRDQLTCDIPLSRVVFPSSSFYFLSRKGAMLIQIAIRVQRSS